MGNCLVTKLKGTVSNPDLLGVGEMFIYGQIGTTGENQDLKLQGYYVTESNNTVIEIEGATFGTLNEAATSNGAVKIDDTHVKLPGTTGSDTRIGVVGTAGTIFRLRVKNKYNLRAIDAANGISGIYANVDDLLYTPNLKIYNTKINTTAFINYLRDIIGGISFNGLSKAEFKDTLEGLNIYAISGVVSLDLANLYGFTNLINFSLGNLGSGVIGDIANLRTSIKLYNISLENTGVNGNISYLGPCTALCFIDLTTCNISGTMEAFVQGQRGASVNPRTTNSTGINVNTLGKYVTIGGNVPTETWQKLKWSTTQITFGNVTVDA